MYENPGGATPPCCRRPWLEDAAASPVPTALLVLLLAEDAYCCSNAVDTELPSTKLSNYDWDIFSNIQQPKEF